MKCHESYEELTSYDEKGKYPKVKCPNCKSKRKKQLHNYGVGVSFGNPKESSKWDNFSYRAGFNMDKAQGERRTAQKLSHMGTNPYPDLK